MRFARVLIIIRYILVLLPILPLLAGCDVHEFPEVPEKISFHLRLNYDTDMVEWKHHYNGTSVTEQGAGKIYDNSREYGEIRYIIRAYPLIDKQRTTHEPTQEFVFTKDIAEGYNHEVTLDLLPGDYNIMVWSDLMQQGDNAPFHNTEDFAKITLQGKHQGNDNHRDTYRGSNSISLTAQIIEQKPKSLDIAMQRPLAKYEFITTDLSEFIDKELTRLDKKSRTTANANEDATTKVNLDDYRVVFHYSGFMPNTYSMFTDKPISSSTGISFESTLKRVNKEETSLGFDYVFVNGTEALVTVQVGVYDKEGEQLSLTEPINVPLKRSQHTLLRGSFLMQKATGNVGISPDFDGNYNVKI